MYRHFLTFPKSTTSLAIEHGKTTPTAPLLEKCIHPEPQDSKKSDEEAEAEPLMDEITAQRLADSRLRALRNPMMQ